MEEVRRWNSRVRRRGGFRGRVLVRVEGKGWERSFLVELEGWKIKGLREAREGERAEISFSFPLRLMKGRKDEEELVWMIIKREVKVKGKFRGMARNLSLWASLLPFLASLARKVG